MCHTSQTLTPPSQRQQLVGKKTCARDHSEHGPNAAIMERCRAPHRFALMVHVSAPYSRNARTTPWNTAWLVANDTLHIATLKNGLCQTSKGSCNLSNAAQHILSQLRVICDVASKIVCMKSQQFRMSRLLIVRCNL